MVYLLVWLIVCSFCYSGHCFDEEKFQWMENEILELTKGLKQYDSEYRGLIQKYSDSQRVMEKKITELENRVKNQEIHIQVLHNSCNSKSRHPEKVKNKQFHDKVVELRLNETQFKTPVVHEAQPIVDYERRELDTRNAPTIRVASGSVAFSAYMSQHEPEPSPHHIFIFDTVITNVGNAYNKHSGVFSVPQTGIYVFTWTVYCDVHGYIFSQIVKNSALFGASFSDGFDSTYTQSSNGIIVMEVNEGDTVFIRTHPTNPNSGRILSNPLQYRTSFSGWKIA